MDKEGFLQELRAVPDVKRAARRIGVSHQTAYHHKGKDSKFAAEWDDAIETGMDTSRRRRSSGPWRGMFSWSCSC
jgi:hypothetical protein